MTAGDFFVVVCSGTVSPGFCPPPAEGDVVFNINMLRSPYIHFGLCSEWCVVIPLLFLQCIVCMQCTVCKVYPWNDRLHLSTCAAYKSNDSNIGIVFDWKNISCCLSFFFLIWPHHQMLNYWGIGTAVIWQHHTLNKVMLTTL